VYVVYAVYAVLLVAPGDPAIRDFHMFAHGIFLPGFLTVFFTLLRALKALKVFNKISS